MLQTNLIFGIQQKIKAGSKHAHKMGILEESTTETNKVEKDNRIEPILESSFISGIYEKAAAAQKKEEGKKVLITESFHFSKARKKLEKDINYFNYLFENFVDDVSKDQYTILLESILDDTIRLYEECDITPRLVSPVLDSNELSENQIVDIYKNRLNETIKNQYTKPFIKGTISELYENEIRDITKKLITEGVDLDMGQIKVYLPFEETIYKFNKEILIPKNASHGIELFMESMTDDYLEFIEESAADILKTIEKKIKLLTSLVSPNIFDKAVEADGVDAPKMAGISITIDKNFNDGDCDEGGGPGDLASSDPEAAEEMADEVEAEEIENSDEIVNIEDAVRDNMDLATDSEDYENTPEMEGEAEESAAEETSETGEQPGAIEIDMGLDDGNLNPDNGMVTNDDDVSLSGNGQETGVDPNGCEATLPGGAANIGSELGVAADTTQYKEDVSSESPDEEEENLEDVSEGKDKETISEGTIQDKKPVSQGGAPSKAGSMPGGGTTQDKNFRAASTKAQKLNSGKIKQDKKPVSQGGAPTKAGSMPGGGTTQDKRL
jgi:hypothetical protein